MSAPKVKVPKTVTPQSPTAIDDEEVVAARDETIRRATGRGYLGTILTGMKRAPTGTQTSYMPAGSSTGAASGGSSAPVPSSGGSSTPVPAAPTPAAPTPAATAPTAPASSGSNVFTAITKGKKSTFTFFGK